MGGKALKHLGVGRISDVEYKKRVARFHILMGDKPTNIRVEYYIPGDVHKDDRGDLDVLYWSSDNAALTAHLEKSFNAKGSKKNGNVKSIEWEGFQVDMISMSQEELQFAKHYYAHGTCAALMGRLASYYNFHMGWQGFGFRLRVDNIKRTTMLTRDWQKALNVLGYREVLEPSQNYSVAEVFDHIASSELLSKEVYRQSKPDRNYGFQEEFFNWVDKQPVEENGPPRVYGWFLLFKYFPLTAVKLTFEYLSMWKEYLLRPIKRRWKKLWFTTLYPLGFKLRGW